MEIASLQPTSNVDTDETNQRFAVECAARAYAHRRISRWPAAKDFTAADTERVLLASSVAPWGSEALWEDSEALATIRVQGGEITATAAAATPEEAARCLDRIRELLPAHETDQPDLVPVSFWTVSPHGGRSIRRDIDAEAWEAIEENYPHADGLADLMSADFRPGVGGQLVLWHGEAGAGKTSALRALAREWRDWCELHYIVDPDVFFGSRADYMMQVLTGEAELKEPGSEPRWRLLVLEDCGEMLQPDAKREVGQAVARLLNACDGLIGRGLRFLVLLTTNEPVEKLHEAVARPGRCAARVEFESFTAIEAREWVERHGGLFTGLPSGHATLAELYGLVHEFRTRPRERRVGFAA